MHITRFYCLLFACCFVTIINGQEADTSKLFRDLQKMDSLLFNIGFNTCDISQFEKLLSEEFSFYHDLSGITGSKAAFLENTRNGLCKLNYQPVRKLVPGSLQVFKLTNNGNVYGALQMGVHQFYAKEKDKPMYFTSIARFTHLWLLENGGWKLKQGLSYDHGNKNWAVAAGEPMYFHAKSIFERYGVTGSTTVYDHAANQWIFTDSVDALQPSFPASTFKIMNLLIALETGVIKDELTVVKWPGKTDTALYGYRPEIYHDMTVKEAFEVSAGWVFIELAKKIGVNRYKSWLQRCGYGNVLPASGDFWNFGPLKISPKNQLEFLIKVYEEKLPFSKRNLGILKKVMVTEKKENYTVYSKTGWTRVNNDNLGWWVGYVEKQSGVYFFATRIRKPRLANDPDFGQNRKDITRDVLRQLHISE